MRRTLFLVIAACVLLVLILPMVVLNIWRTPRVSIKTAGPGIRVKMHDTGKVVVMPLEEYLVGVVAAEMPALFHEEALKAQAVAARTYTLKNLAVASTVPTIPVRTFVPIPIIVRRGCLLWPCVGAGAWFSTGHIMIRLSRRLRRPTVWWRLTVVS